MAITSLLCHEQTHATSVSIPHSVAKITRAAMDRRGEAFCVLTSDTPHNAILCASVKCVEVHGALYTVYRYAFPKQYALHNKLRAKPKKRLRSERAAQTSALSVRLNGSTKLPCGKELRNFEQPNTESKHDPDPYCSSIHLQNLRF